MGYYTDFYGCIELSEKGFISVKTNWEWIRDKIGMDNSEIDLNETNKCIDIGGNWKNRDEWFQKFCYIITLLDKECDGHIDCKGEDNEDLWYIELNEGNVEIYQGRIEYDMSGNFKDLETKKMVYDLSKDEELGKEIMLDILEKENGS